jgi:hypothetical protein
MCVKLDNFPTGDKRSFKCIFCLALAEPIQAASNHSSGDMGDVSILDQISEERCLSFITPPNTEDAASKSYLDKLLNAMLIKMNENICASENRVIEEMKRMGTALGNRVEALEVSCKKLATEGMMSNRIQASTLRENIRSRQYSYRDNLGRSGIPSQGPNRKHGQNCSSHC